ncbi:MAG: polysaccharide deacetylase family protein [Phyllobacteriaceae bacterium]|jgi:peptidoglycan/xylan/chitin deacetylase (PgdA/CDA1 family)|nr:polysaccharide deacetylase family protein [Phyllobacteriaceae bacterium]
MHARGRIEPWCAICPEPDQDCRGLKPNMGTFDDMTVRASAKRFLKYGTIRTALEAFALPGMRSLFPSAAGRGMIFTLHHVRPERQGDKFSPNAILSVTPEFLETSVQTALESGLTPVHLHDLPALLADPDDDRRFVAFTLDDGYRNNAEFAAPVFRRHRVPYTIFINPGFAERTRTIWWETAAAITRKADAIAFDFGNGPETLKTETTAQKLAAFEQFAAFVQSIDEDEAVARIDAVARDHHHIDPVAIVETLVMDEAALRVLAEDPLVHLGAHTMTHVNLRRVCAGRLKDEIEQSAAAVQAYANRRPLSFSYPYGWTTAVGERETRAAAEAGFAAAVTTQPGVLDARCLDRPTALPRVSLNGYFQKKRYVSALLSGLPFKLMSARAPARPPAAVRQDQ